MMHCPYKGTVVNDIFPVKLQRAISLHYSCIKNNDAFLRHHARKLSSVCVASGFYYTDVSEMLKIINSNEHGPMHINMLFHCSS